MKRIKLLLIATAALALAMPVAGCMHADSGNAKDNGVEQRIETQPDENDDCQDGNCDECPDGECPDKDGECPGDECPDKDDSRPARLLPPRFKHGKGRIPPMLRPKASF